MNPANTDRDQFYTPSKLPREFAYLDALIRYRIDNSMNELNIEDRNEPAMPVLKDWQPHLAAFITQNNLSVEASQLLLIGLTPYLYPDLFDEAIKNALPEDKFDFPKIGGTRGKNCRFFLPTGETANYIIAGDQYERRSVVEELFGAEHMFWERKILWLEDLQHAEPPMHGRIIMSQDYVEFLTSGVHKSPQFSISFPAKKIKHSRLKYDSKAAAKEQSSCAGQQSASPWDLLVINDELKMQIDELRSWLKYNDELINQFDPNRQFRRGYRSLFYGPPGTGKTFTARLLGDDLGKDVFKIDLSLVVSKYIGETEKNLEMLFARAEDKGWILFFDEADALFGKRTNVRDAHDKYANQEVSYLLQRIEDYNGLIILATNMKNNIDDAFIRRFNSILKFPLPNADDREKIWNKLFPQGTLFLDNSASDNPQQVDVPLKVKGHELSGGNINNIVHYAALKGFERMQADKGRHCPPGDRLVVYLDDVLNGIRRELVKEGKPFVL